MSTDKHEEKWSFNRTAQIRRFLSQFAATTIQNMLLFDVGLCNTFPMIIIPALTGITNDHNLNETLKLTSVQASWLGSISFITQPIGCLMSALFTDHLGRKRSMMLVNLPFLVAWLMMFKASTVWQIFIATALFGLAVGMMETPTVTYIGEICEPRFRSILMAYTQIGWTLGMLVMTTLNTLMPWRMVALICMFVPIISTIALFFIPETPLWLLSKNRPKSAVKALCWLRGWTLTSEVAQELQEMQRYSDHYKSCNLCIKQNQKCSHPLPTLVEKFRELKRKQTLKPFLIVVPLFIISALASSWFPFVVQIFKAYESPIPPDMAAALLALMNNAANIFFICLIRFTGKRLFYLIMLSLTFLSSLILCGYGFAILPAGYNSFDQIQTFSLSNKQLGYIPFVCILLTGFCLFCGVATIPWQMVSEIFPYKSRGVATGITAAVYYLLNFIATKSYYNLEITLSMPGVALFNCVIFAVGLILMYKILPNTENRTLEDIEMHFSDNSKKLTDRKIARILAPSSAESESLVKNNEEYCKTIERDVTLTAMNQFEFDTRSKNNVTNANLVDHSK